MVADHSSLLLLNFPVIFRNHRFLLPISLNHIICSYHDIFSPLLLTPGKMNGMTPDSIFFYSGIWCPSGHAQITMTKAHLF